MKEQWYLGKNHFLVSSAYWHQGLVWILTYWHLSDKIDDASIDTNVGVNNSLLKIL